MDELYRDSFPFSDFSTTSADSDSADHMRPFDRFLKNPSLDMLNSALPYVSGNMRKPLALFIKTLEIDHIVNDFDREEVLTACGFENNAPNPEDMLKAMKMAGGKNANPQIDQLLNMMNMVRAYQSFQEIMQSNPEMAALVRSMMNQGPNFGFNTGSAPSSNSGSNSNTGPSQTTNGNNSNFSPADLLSQLTGKDSSDMMALLSQMLKNS